MSPWKVESFQWAVGVFITLISLVFQHRSGSTRRFGNNCPVHDLDCRGSVVLYLKHPRPLYHPSSIENIPVSKPACVSVFSFFSPSAVFLPMHLHICSLEGEPLLSTALQRSEGQAGFCCLHKLSVLRTLCIPRSKRGLSEQPKCP